VCSPNPTGYICDKVFFYRTGSKFIKKKRAADLKTNLSFRGMAIQTRLRGPVSPPFAMVSGVESKVESDQVVLEVDG
jgi:hypothetical protein